MTSTPPAATPAPATPAQARPSWPQARFGGLVPTVPTKPGPRTLGAATVFGAQVAGMRKLQEGPGLDVTRPARSFTAIRIRHEELQQLALGDKGFRAEALGMVLEFVTWARESARQVEEPAKRAALSQMLGFWAGQVAPHVPSPLQVELPAPG
ncbi:MAG: hypothetical protein HY904_06945 [Deltaproteobacteria bacterium]|nr:hypothetical protein [Deltaproteobacteria bacterium]